MTQQPGGKRPSQSQPSKNQPSPYARGLDESFPGEVAQLDPEERALRDARSTRQAIYYFISVPIIVLVLAGIVLIASRTAGGPLCEAGDAQWLCSRASQIWFSLLPGIVAMGSVFLAAYITYRKWKTQQRWRWWIAVVWISMPFALAWITGTGSLLLLGK